MDNIRILMVDDDEAWFVLTRDLLRDDGHAQYTLDWVAAYEPALAAIARNEHDVYVLDFQLGAHNGLELLEQVKQHCPGKPAILLTGYGDSETDTAALQAGAADYWCKDQINGALLDRSIRYAVARKRSERLERERKSLRDAARAMEQVLGVVGHELRTPLASLRAMSEYLITDGVRGTPEFDHFLQAINLEVQRMNEMVNNMLEAARLDSGLAKWNWTPVNVATVCQEAAEVVRPLLNSPRVTLTVNVEPADLTMQGDADAVRRLLVNLLTNAHKHTTDGFIRLQARAEKSQAAWVACDISDTGCGIPPQMVQDLGKAFALNTGAVGRGYVKGAGLGLAICRGIVGAHGGTISVHSEPHAGTTFHIHLRADLNKPVTEQRARIVHEAAA